MTDIHPADRGFGSPEEYDLGEYGTLEPREALVSPKHFPAILLSTFVGGYGIDRMYIGRVGLGIAKLAAHIFTLVITLVLLGLGPVVEIEAGDTIDLSDLFWDLARYYAAMFGLSLPVAIWVIVDNFLIGSGRAIDGNGNPLIAYEAKGETVTQTRAYQPPRQTVVSPQHRTAVLLSTIPVTNFLGIDRMYMGRVGMGIAKLVTFGGLGVWAVVDGIIIAKGSARDGNGDPLIRCHSTDRLSVSLQNSIPSHHS